ncbi:hypothetical protein JCM12141A_54870 [Mycolicibacterium hodleri]
MDALRSGSRRDGAASWALADLLVSPTLAPAVWLRIRWEDRAVTRRSVARPWGNGQGGGPRTTVPGGVAARQFLNPDKEIVRDDPRWAPRTNAIGAPNHRDPFG